MEEKNELNNQEPNAAIVHLDLLKATIQYLNSKPRGEVNNIATALEASKLITLETKAETEEVEKPIQKAKPVKKLKKD